LALFSSSSFSFFHLLLLLLMLQDLSNVRMFIHFKTDQDLSHHVLLFKYLLELQMAILEVDNLACYLHVVPIHTDIHCSKCHIPSFKLSYFFLPNILARRILFPEYRIPRSYVVRNLPRPLSF